MGKFLSFRFPARSPTWYAAPKPEKTVILLGRGLPMSAPDEQPSIAAAVGVVPAADLFAALYNDLRTLAQNCLRKCPDDGLSPSALVHEAYIRFADRNDWQGRTHLMATAAVAMRGILVDMARQRAAAKRGGKRRRVKLSSRLMEPVTPIDVLGIDEALTALKRRNERQSLVVELRFFGGMTIQEAAEVLQVSEATIESDWRFARAWLSARLSEYKTK